MDNAIDNGQLIIDNANFVVKYCVFICKRNFHYQLSIVNYPLNHIQLLSEVSISYSHKLA